MTRHYESIFMRLKNLFLFDKIGTKVAFPMAVITVLVLVLGLVSYLMNARIYRETTAVSSRHLPGVVNAVSMQNVLSDMNSNVLEYVLGEADEKEEFERNRALFLEHFVNFKKSYKEDSLIIQEIGNLFNDYYGGARAEILNKYEPANEEWARQRTDALITNTGFQLEELLTEMKDSEIADAGSNPVLEVVLMDDLPGVTYYLELVDEAEDMMSSLSQYVNGNIEMALAFDENTQDFEKFLALLKPLEEKAEEVRKIKEIESLYRVLRNGTLEVFSGYKPQNKLHAIQTIDSLEHQVYSRLEGTLTTIAVESDRSAGFALQALRDQTSQTNRLLVALLSAIILISVTISIYIYRTITRPVAIMSSALRSLASGTLDRAVPYTGRQDEIGDLARSYDVFRRNIEDRIVAEKLLEEEKEKAEAANRAKSEFLANMSHEIRTPMNSILGFTQIMQQKVSDKTILRYIDTIHSSGKTLLNLINDILDLSIVEAGKVKLQYGAVSVRHLIRELDLVYRHEVEGKKLQLLVDIPTDIPESLLLDEARLRRVLINLLSNAVKFTGEGYIKVGVYHNYPESTNQSIIDLTFYVEDTGVGVARDQRELIFEAFEQQKGQKISEYGGTGLGLAITEKLVRLMGGVVTLESEKGGGSVFKVALPGVEICSTSANHVPDGDSSETNIEFLQSKVLLADDIKYNRELIIDFIGESEIEWIEASNGEEAIAMARKHRPDLILLDMKMPVMDGFVASETLKNDKDLGDIPIIAVTASALKSDEDKIRQYCSSYLRKPVSRKELTVEMAKYLPCDKMGKLASGDVALEQGEVMLDREALSKNSELVPLLKNQYLVIGSLLETVSIDRVEAFSSVLKEYGLKYDSQNIIDIGEMVASKAATFDEERIKDFLVKLREQLKDL